MGRVDVIILSIIVIIFIILCIIANYRKKGVLKYWIDSYRLNLKVKKFQKQFKEKGIDLNRKINWNKIYREIGYRNIYSKNLPKYFRNSLASLYKSAKQLTPYQPIDYNNEFANYFGSAMLGSLILEDPKTFIGKYVTYFNESGAYKGKLYSEYGSIDRYSNDIDKSLFTFKVDTIYDKYLYDEYSHGAHISQCRLATEKEMVDKKYNQKNIEEYEKQIDELQRLIWNYQDRVSELKKL